MAARKYAKYQKKYEKENLRQINVKLNHKTDNKLIEWLDKQANVQGYIKRIITEDMEKSER